LSVREHVAGQPITFRPCLDQGCAATLREADEDQIEFSTQLSLGDEVLHIAPPDANVS
jgi:hypothetical protein